MIPYYSYPDGAVSVWYKEEGENSHVDTADDYTVQRCVEHLHIDNEWIIKYFLPDKIIN